MILLPPHQYDHPFNGRLIVHVERYFDVAKECGQYDPVPGSRVEACARVFPDPQNPEKLACTVIYPRLKDVGSDDMVALIRHETAHCNGWPADHPGALF